MICLGIFWATHLFFDSCTFAFQNLADMKFRNFKMVDYVVYGRGCFNQLDEIMTPHRKGSSPMVFLIDHFFEGKPLASRVPLRGKDRVIFIDVTLEPKTSY